MTHRSISNSGRRLDHQSWTRHGYPAVSIVEGDQAEGAWLPFPHTGERPLGWPERPFFTFADMRRKVMDRTEIPPAVGEFSYEVHPFLSQILDRISKRQADGAFL